MGLVRRLLDEAQFLLAPRLALGVLVGLLVLDALFLATHAAHVIAIHVGSEGALADRAFSIEQDGGYSERYEYAKTAACSLALGACFAATRQPVHAGLAVIYVLLLSDNAFELHERLGEEASVLFGPAQSLFATAPQALGEVLVFGLGGLMVLAIAVITWRRSSPEHRDMAMPSLVLIGLLGVFGVGVDLVHAAFSASYPLDRLFGLIEDGGELVVLSVSCAIALGLVLRLVPGAGHLSVSAPSRPGPAE